MDSTLLIRMLKHDGWQLVRVKGTWNRILKDAGLK